MVRTANWKEPMLAKRTDPIVRTTPGVPPQRREIAEGAAEEPEDAPICLSCGGDVSEASNTCSTCGAEYEISNKSPARGNRIVTKY